MCKILGIVACSPSGVIGNQGKLPWSYSKDIEFFAKTIENKPLVMGRKTWEGLPEKYTKGRQIFVFSRSFYDNAEGVIWVSSLEEFFSLELPPSVFLIGGGDLFSLFLENQLLTGCFVTHIHRCYDGDAFFPLSLLVGWNKTILDEQEDLTFCYYESLADSHT
ncbi:dihydrofolate reductase [Chlamydia felis Fe/C-56]|uniref:dihydrofolate reductase n=1 Tax=Chlamydia felis (strain Fe/C-56) TaxID=264202 RepID=Q256K1_CHLFF|nr:dihydrofolate reductase [Chlamydia felis]BAE80787.1 dihydrofolate reductase [Chlamydia felis Fe/C-56]